MTPITRRGRTKCTVTYNAAGPHTVGVLYSGSLDGAFAGATDIQDATVVVTQIAFARPVVRVGSRSFIVTVTCPLHSGGCRVISNITITLAGTKGAITSRRLSARLRAGRARPMSFALSNPAVARLRSYLRRPRRPSLGVTVRLVISEANGATGRRTFSYRIRSARSLARL